MSGGNAVFRARALYSIVEVDKHYDDHDLCAQAGISPRQPKKETRLPAAYVHPNPANNEATLEYDIPEDASGIFRLYSATGQQLLIKKLAGGKLAYTFKTSGLYPGVYHYDLLSNDSPVAVGKLVIIR